MAGEVYEYYFRNYAVHFSSDAMSTAFATIPQVGAFRNQCIHHADSGKSAYVLGNVHLHMSATLGPLTVLLMWTARQSRLIKTYLTMLDSHCGAAVASILPVVILVVPPSNSMQALGSSALGSQL